MTGRPNRVTLDPSALAYNLGLLRGLLPPGRVIWQVCKGEGYGLGTRRAALMGAAAGIDRFCVGTPDEALTLREALPEAEVLLFPGACPGDLPALARAGVTVSLHHADSLAAMAGQGGTARTWLKLDSGLHRYGLDPTALEPVLALLRAGALPGLQGVYTHLSQGTDPAAAQASLARFDDALRLLRAAAPQRLRAMAAASPLLLARPDLPYGDVDPGRALYGMIRPAPGAASDSGLRPVVQSIRSVLLDSHVLPEGAALGYGPRAEGRAPRRVGTMPLGHFDGLPPRAPFGRVLIRGQEAPVLARTLLASLIDLDGIDTAVDGDPVTLVGGDGAARLTLDDLAQDLGLSVTELHFGLIRALPKVEG